MKAWFIQYLEKAGGMFLGIASIPPVIHTSHHSVPTMTSNLCLQSNTITTSMVESENNRKNIRRLRSACVQNFESISCIYLMDFYQNEQIVHSQLSYLKKHFQGTGEIVRDKFMRFTFVPSLAS
ncbi:hypothetical protein OS493_012314 [Desmophyllum pertusum]|uniref:Uncharacterized protein n=1 Tax=Desmophyllum pertusum TaxID=174260 RepID=A0A9W9ZQC2_9CNID|nr:hypothetical protein OS493_012314 [Desmophyllum pertusum]